MTTIVDARPAVVFKLASPKGTLLGTVTIPEQWVATLERNGGVEFVLAVAVGLPWASLVEPDGPPPMCRVGTIALSYMMRGAVELHGITLEEFERMPGCSFTPGAAYLRSMVE